MVKLSIIVLILLATVCEMSAQDMNMLSGNPLWKSSFYANNKFERVEPIALIDDNEFGLLEKDGITYHQIFQIEALDIAWEGCTIYMPCEPIRAREEAGRVYILYEDFQGQVSHNRSFVGLKDNVSIPYQRTSENELLLYDFTLQAGDPYPTTAEYEGIFVEKVDTVITNDAKSRKLFTLSNGLQILEGIGCLNSRKGTLLYYLYPPNVWRGNLQLYYSRLYEYQKDGKVIYKEETPTNVKITYSYKNVQNPNFFSLSGHRLITPPTRKGIYIRDGKKVMVK